MMGVNSAYPFPRNTMLFNFFRVLSFVALLGVNSPVSRAAELNEDARLKIQKRIDDRAAESIKIAEQIWDFAEIGYQETRSAALLKEQLKKEGFKITERVGDLPTAFMAEYGSGKPVIGILGEYDALPGMQQDHAPLKRPEIATKPGHACGHNLFGTASALAAITVKEWLVENKAPGTIRFYGCPAEEGGSGKVFMVRAGAFNDCDAVLHWHPNASNRASNYVTYGNVTGKFRFLGTAAHASAAPEKGRSALDGVLLFTHAVEMLREHIPRNMRMHYIITNGGDAPNIVPAQAEVYLYLRSDEMKVIDDVWPRLIKCGEGAALATETRFVLEYVSSAYTMLPNPSLASLLDKQLKHVGGVKYNDEERAFAADIQATLTAAKLPVPSLAKAQLIDPPSTEASAGSSDVADVSWNVPTGGFSTATFVPGVPLHSWQAVACAGHSSGHKGMLNAAKVLTLGAVELLTNPAEVRAAREDYERQKGKEEYRSRLPADFKPNLEYRK
jgi:aminobenzoyl-glutamate utilization protein B